MDAARAWTDVNWKHWVVWVGRAVSLWPVYVLTRSATWKLTAEPWYVSEWQRIGYDEALLTTIGIIQVACLVLYIVPQTSVLGTVMLTGYLGGAIASYARMGEPSPILVPLSTSLTAWLGLYLREPRFWFLLPIRFGRR